MNKWQSNEWMRSIYWIDPVSTQTATPEFRQKFCFLACKLNQHKCDHCNATIHIYLIIKNAMVVASLNAQFCEEWKWSWLNYVYSSRHSLYHCFMRWNALFFWWIHFILGLLFRLWYYILVFSGFRVFGRIETRAASTLLFTLNIIVQMWWCRNSMNAVRFRSVLS